MLIIADSPAAVAPSETPDASLAQVFIDYAAQGYITGLISNHNKPSWFHNQLDGTGVQFIRTAARQKGEIIARSANTFGLEPYDIIVLAAKDVDVQMRNRISKNIFSEAEIFLKKILPKMLI